VVLSRVPAAAFLERNGDGSLKSLALRAFNRSIASARGQDGIVDLAVVLEALFSDGTTELTHKVAMRAALLIGYPPSRATKVFETVRAFYALRSAIVHANPGNVEAQAIEVFRSWRGRSKALPRRDLRETNAMFIGAEVVAAILRACLHLESSGHDPFSKSFPGKLDQMAFDPRARRKLLIDARVLPERRSR